MGGRASLAPHDERARKNGYEHRIRRIELLKRLYDVVEKLECARRFEESPYVKKVRGGKGADLNPPQITLLAPPHRPKASAGALEPRR